MDRRVKWISLSFAIAATLFYGQQSNAQHVRGGCATGDCGVSSSFGYPGGSSCASCGPDRRHRLFGHHGSGQLHSHIQNVKAYNQKAFERNQAWPQPFACADRQLYFAIWEPMLTNGYQLNCVFQDAHFDPKTHELNKAGKSKIAGIFRNNPIGQKVALVQNSGPADVVNARLRNVQATVAQWYGTENFQQVALTNKFPNGFSAARVQALNQLSMDETPVPIIPIGTGEGSTNDTGLGN